ncbi:MAG: ABC transporter substrate-binding protein [Pseudomonadota bacterium]
MMSRVVMLFVLTNFLSAMIPTTAVNAAESIQIAYVKTTPESYAGVPAYMAIAEDDGLAGARVAIVDANKTGKFLGYQLVLNEINLASDLSLTEDQQSTIKASSAIIIDADIEQYNALVESLTVLNSGALLLNVRNLADDARSQHCSSLLVHIAPTYQMKADALAQWLVTKRIKDVLTIYGPTAEDKAFVQSFETSAKKFRLNIVEAKEWQFSFDLRRNAFTEIPVFTRTRKKYSAVFSADHASQFAYSLPFNTHLIVPVIGSAGLKPVGWHLTHEQWGARQLQGRFSEQAGRRMSEFDYFAYVAITTVSAAVQQLKERTGQNIYDQLVDQQANIAAYKGRQLTFRKNTRQLRQPILLAHAGALVTHAPLTGFLHQSNDLDTLGNESQVCEVK